jgi:serine/threonine-protein kinase
VTRQGLAYVVLEPFYGVPLDQALRSRKFSASQTLRIAQQILAGLHAAHAAGAVHGHLRPSSVVLLGAEYETRSLKLFGFGMDGLFQGDSRAHADLRFVAPEQLAGAPAETRSDVYSLAALAFEMLAGHAAFAAESPALLRQRILSGEHASLARACPELPEALVALVEAGIARQRSERPKSASDFADELESALSTLEAPAKRDLRRSGSHRAPPSSGPRPSRIPTDVPAEDEPILSLRCSSSAAPECDQPAGTGFQGLSESLLISPRIPRAANTPDLDGKRRRPRPPPPRRVKRRPATRRAQAALSPVFVLLAGTALGILVSWFAGF